MTHGTPLTSEPIPSDPGVWRDKQAARYLTVSRDTLRIWRQRKHRGRGPAFVRVGRLVRYLRADLDAWLALNRVDPRAASVAKPAAVNAGDRGTGEQCGAAATEKPEVTV